MKFMDSRRRLYIPVVGLLVVGLRLNFDFGDHYLYIAVQCRFNRGTYNSDSDDLDLFYLYGIQLNQPYPLPFLTFAARDDMSLC